MQDKIALVAASVLVGLVIAACSSTAEVAAGSTEQAEASNYCKSGHKLVKPVDEECNSAGKVNPGGSYFAFGGMIHSNTNPETIDCTYSGVGANYSGLPFCDWTLTDIALANPACDADSGDKSTCPSPADPPTVPSVTIPTDIPNDTALIEQADKNSFCGKNAPDDILARLTKLCTDQRATTESANGTCCTTVTPPAANTSPIP
jgi:hypothetical protein